MMRSAVRLRAILLAACASLGCLSAPSAASLRIIRIEPVNQASVFIEDPRSGKRFQASPGDEIAPSETLDIAGAAVRVVVRDTDTNQVATYTRAKPLRVRDAGLAGNALTTLADIFRFTSRPGASQSSRRCEALPELAAVDLPMLAGEEPLLAGGRHAIGTRVVAPQGVELVGVLFDPSGRIAAEASVREGRWQSPVLDLSEGRYVLGLRRGTELLVRRGFKVVSSAPDEPAGLGDDAPGIDRRLAHVLWLARLDGGVWRFEAQQLLLRIPNERRGEVYGRVLQAFDDGLRLDKQGELGPCLR